MTEPTVSSLQDLANFFRLDSGQVCEKGLRATEISRRTLWFIQTRWVAVGLCSLGTLLATLTSMYNMAGCHIDFRYFLVVVFLLTASNLLYTRLAQNLNADPPQQQKWSCRFLNIQVLSDFTILSILTYGLGGIETPILTLFLPHIILSTLFFARFYSFVMTWIGIVFATLPVILEYLGVVPTLSIFDPAQKVARISSSLVMTLGYTLGIAAAFFVCWYLVSEITSSLRRREQELEEAYDRLQLLAQEKSQVTLRATHELKAPFAAIKSYVYTLRDGYCGVLPEKAQQVVARIGERCDLLMEKISDIIHLSNLRTATPANATWTEIDLVTVLTKEVDEARLLGQARGITVQFHPASTPCPILASREHLHTLIANLLRNAVNYSKANGIVEVSLVLREDQTECHVQDHGIGIPAEHLSKIFDEHFRSNNAVRHNPNSSGMGLALVREIVRLHGGDIQVSSQLGEGSRFTVTFARLPQPPKTGDEHGQNFAHR
ncbi:MAG: HAMP domain-containing histidine kinase [Magnetococcus sp. DMHC-1]